MISHAGRVAAIVALSVFAVGGANAQTKAAAPAPAQPAAPAAASAQAPRPAPQDGWAVSCAAANRAGALNCAVEQKIIARETGQLVSAVAVRVPGDTRQPVLVVQLPFGLSLPSGVKAQIDQSAPTNLVVETCEPSGCFVIMPASKAVLDAMAAGQTLELQGTTVAKEPFKVSHPLTGFKAAYDSIK